MELDPLPIKLHQSWVRANTRFSAQLKLSTQPSSTSWGTLSPSEQQVFRDMAADVRMLVSDALVQEARNSPVLHRL